MCDVSNDVENVVNSFVAQGKMFTAFDVTKLLRKQGFQCNHRDVRLVVHSMHMRGGISPDYVRTNHEIDNAVWAFVYHEYRDDVNQYDPSADLSVGDGALAVKVLVQDPAEDEDDEDDVTVADSSTDKPVLSAAVTVDARGRACVKAACTRAIGLKSHDYVSICNISNGISGNRFVSIRTATPKNGNYIVDKDCNIRIGRHVWEMMGLPTVCDAYSDRIEIR